MSRWYLLMGHFSCIKLLIINAATGSLNAYLFPEPQCYTIIIMLTKANKKNTDATLCA